MSWAPPLPGGHVVEDIRADQNTLSGIIVQGSGNIVRDNQGVLAVNNRITQADVGILYDGAFFSTGKYRDDLTFDVVAPFAGTGTDAGNND